MEGQANPSGGKARWLDRAKAHKKRATGKSKKQLDEECSLSASESALPRWRNKALSEHLLVWEIPMVVGEKSVEKGADSAKRKAKQVSGSARQLGRAWQRMLSTEPCRLDLFDWRTIPGGQGID